MNLGEGCGANYSGNGRDHRENGMNCLAHGRPCCEWPPSSFCNIAIPAAEERAWDEDCRESRDDFTSRLCRLAKAIPLANVQRAIGDLSWRAKALYKAKGGLFEEGGRRGRRG